MILEVSTFEVDKAIGVALANATQIIISEEFFFGGGGREKGKKVIVSVNCSFFLFL